MVLLCTLALPLLASLACGPKRPAPAKPAAPEARAGKQQSGLASWYGKPFHGRTTASGERYDMHQMTAAHRSLPFGTRVRVTNMTNGRQTVVRINDRGPFVGGRIIDLSYAAAAKLGMVQDGVAKVRLEILRTS